MNKLTWNSFTKKIHIKASIELLYQAWATKEGICAWFLKDAVYERETKEIGHNTFIEKGDLYTWKWHNWDGTETGKIIKANGVDFIQFSFAGETIVTVSLEQREDAVLVSLNQSNIPVDEKSKLEIFYGCSNGWTFWLANLKAFLEHGILLNETEINLRGFNLAGYEFVNM